MKSNLLTKTAIILFSFLTCQSFLVGQEQANSKPFKATLLSESEATHYNKPDPNALLFRLNTDEIIQFIQLKKSDELSISLNIGDHNFDLILSIDPSRSGQPKSKGKKGESFRLIGKSSSSPNSKVSLFISPQTFLGSIIIEKKEYSFSNAEKGGKSSPNIFYLMEHPFIKVKKENAENLLLGCPYYNVELGTQLDQLFVDHFSSFSDPLERAWAEASQAVSNAGGIWSDVISVMSVYNIFNADPYPDDHLFVPNNYPVWSSNITADWNSTRPCIRKDGIIYFTGHALGFAGVTNMSEGFLCSGAPVGSDHGGRVAIIGGIEGSFNSDNLRWTIAHEIGHFFGLGEEGDTPCQSNCSVLLPLAI